MKKKSVKQKIHIVAGPTASGKSAYAMNLARKITREKTAGRAAAGSKSSRQKAVIINCDSLQIYDALPILTAQPSQDDKAEIPHRLYAALHPHDVCSAGNWREMAQPIIEETLANGQTPIICGGTGLYIKALTDGLSPMPDIPEEIRAATVARYESLGAEEFYKELQSRDPVMAARFHVNHKARIIRAMEVLDATGRSLADWQKEDRQGPPEDWNFEIHTITPPRETLYQRCNIRFEKMLETGALEETKDFAQKLETGEIKEGVPITKALGFKQLRAYLNNEISKEDAITSAQTITRNYAKRQMTWIRNQF